MAEFKLDRFKYTWKGDWAAGTEYLRDDIVKVNGKSYVCIISHTADTKFATDLNAILPNSDPPQPQPKWIVMTSGKTFLGNWRTGVDYNLGDLVLYDGTVWICETDHTSTTFAANAVNWEVFAKHIKFVADWTTNTDYGHGAIVRYNGLVYKCLVAHTSLLTLENSIDNWELYYDGVMYRGPWATVTEYRKNDLVRYGGSIFRCTETHVSGTEDLDNSKFILEFPGNQFNGDWLPSVYYNQGDVVRYGGFTYFALANNIEVDPSRESDDSTVAWGLLSKTYNFRGDWNIDEVYLIGDLVKRGGWLYRAVRDVNAASGDGSSTDYLDPEVWEQIQPGQAFRNNWVYEIKQYDQDGNPIESLSVRYSLGDVVYYRGSAWICNFEHIAGVENYPGDNGSGFRFWDELVLTPQRAGMTDKGDLLTFGYERNLEDDYSTLGSSRVPIGEESQKLSIRETINPIDNETVDGLEAYWRSQEVDAQVIYVDPNGIDKLENGWGNSLDKPFKTIRYACEFVEDNYSPLETIKVYAATGRYKEVGPIIIPAGTAVVGDELRATTVEASGPKDEYQNEWVYKQDYILQFKRIITPIITAQPIAPQMGNTRKQNTGFVPAGVDGSNRCLELLDDYSNYIEFRVASGNIDPVKTGSNDLGGNLDITRAARALELNQEFIVDDIIGYLKFTYQDYVFEDARVAADIRKLIRGLKRDLAYDGNYATLFAAKHYANAVNGSQLDDLFYVRDTTGLRNCTIEGLTGTLNPPGVFDIYQRPTGGACVSLDPGWGPDDQRTWIINRSPYIQGVTNIGTACTGKYIDGAYHNGGNRSMVSNDFTQVLSDGIGAWVRNNARAELVSVFTYYCAVGYFAENGGVIRATNGNNSYGKFGSIAEGNDPTEVPQSVTINNRENEAQVNQALAGGGNDQLLVLEYNHCGEKYTTASAEIIGAGDNAATDFRDFRDGGMFQGRLINTKGSGSEGGSGYLTRQGFAQITPDSTSTIRIGSTDPTQFLSEINGMRILIVAGDGTGQYGYITGFDAVTKDVTVARESDGQPGWDHVISGFPINTSLNSTAQYRIEPRLLADAPPTSATASDLLAGRDFAGVAFGGTLVNYNNIPANTGTGETFGLDPIPARFNVRREGQEYTVTISNRGAGYAVGDVILIQGSLLGGVDNTNDLTIVVTQVSDDSTSDIRDFTFSGIGRPDRFVAISQPNIYGYADNLGNWTEGLLDISGDWLDVIAADNRFVAIPKNENRIKFSYTGETWTTRGLPVTESWSDAIYAAGKFIIIAEGTNNVVYSVDGLSWSQTTIPDDLLDDSTNSQWQGITYGNKQYLAVSGSNRSVAVSNNGITWTRKDLALPDDDWDFVGVEYGRNRYLAADRRGKTTYSFDGENWYTGGNLPNVDPLANNTTMYWNKIKYGNGLFVAIGWEIDIDDNSQISGTTVYATSEDGVLWSLQSTISQYEWQVLLNATVAGETAWYVFGKEQQDGAINKLKVGARAKLRADVFQGSFQNIKIWDPGSNYDNENPPNVQVFDDNFVVEVEIDSRIGDSVLGQPDFVNRGSGYRSSTSTITITGDGYADIVPEDDEIVVSGVATVPGPGVQIRIEGILDQDTQDPDDLDLFTGIGVTDLGDDGSGNGTKTVRFKINPRMRNEFNLAHGTAATLRVRYSQCRISGHDFLDIGTGNFEETNYPDIYAGGAYFIAAPENEVYESNGGRVFYVSTDQDGNFRTGELFSVQQSTGIVTISAEFFDLDGLSELSLGGVRLGGSGTVIREFSTDPTFTEDSNNVVPTQRAIATFLADRLSVGGENLETNRIVAGRTSVGGENNEILITDGTYLNIPREVTFDGVDALGNPTAVQGTMISQMLFQRMVHNNS